MPDTLTTNYNWIKPEVGASKTTWGDKWNTNITNIDAKMKEAFTFASAALPMTGGAVTGPITVQHPTGLDNPATVRWVEQILQIIAPLGQIMLWCWNWDSIPAGWALCNGQVSNGLTTPNFDGRVILAASTTGTIGGSWTSTVSGTVGGHVISHNEMCYHNHGYSDPGHVHGVNDYGHSHLYQKSNWVYGNIYSGGSAQWHDVGNAAGGGIDTWTSGANQAFIGIQTAGISITIGYAGGNWSHDHPWSGSVTHVIPYYTAVYIMRTSWPWAPV